MKKRIALMLFILLTLVFVFASCGHECEIVVKDEKAPTCTESGYKITGCTGCDESTSTEVIPALGHDYVSTVVAPTCNQQGYTTQKCSRCGDDKGGAKLDIKQPTGEHKFELVPNSKVEATCHETGYELQKCTNEGCDFQRKCNTVEKLVHKFVEKLTPVNEPTCTTAGMGIRTKNCEYCGDPDPDFTPKNDEVIPALGHDIERTADYLATSIPATCTTKQHDIWKCSRCNYTEEADVGEPLGHDWTVDAGVLAEATCYSLETRTYKCVRFGEEGCVKTTAQGDVTKVIATANSLLPHTPGAAADCDTAQTCTTCLNNPNANGLGEACVNDANGVCPCGKDSNKIHVFAAPTGDHDYDVATGKGLIPEKTVAPTCMRQGYSVYLCTGCNKEYNDNYTAIVPTAHNVDFDTIVGGETVGATCVKYEYSVHACTNTDLDGNPCDYTEEKVVGSDYADHSFAAGEPTGVITCTYCQKSFYDTTYTEGVYEEHEDKEFDDGATLDVTITVSKEVADPMVLTNTVTTGTQVDGSNPDETKIAIIRVITESATVKFTVTVNAGEANEATYEITGAGYIDLIEYTDEINSLTVASVGEGEYSATVHFYGEKAIPATPAP